MGATGRSNGQAAGLLAAAKGFNPSWVPPAGLICRSGLGWHTLSRFQSLMGATGRSNDDPEAPTATPPEFQSLMGATGRSNHCAWPASSKLQNGFNPSWVPPAGLIDADRYPDAAHR